MYKIRFEFKNKWLLSDVRITEKPLYMPFSQLNTEHRRPISIFSTTFFSVFITAFASTLASCVSGTELVSLYVPHVITHILSGCDGFHHFEHINVKCKYTYGPTDGKIGANEMYRINKHNQRRRRRWRQ